MLGFLRRIFWKREFRVWSVDQLAGGYRVGNLLIRRSDVVVIVAFKRDLVTVDQLCLGIGYGPRDADGGHASVYIEEDNPTYRAVLADLEQHFDLMGGWFAKVTRPAFETNWTTIWSRSGDSNAGDGPRGHAADRP
jgi:hypothetical protein